MKDMYMLILKKYNVEFYCPINLLSPTLKAGTMAYKKMWFRCKFDHGGQSKMLCLRQEVGHLVEEVDSDMKAFHGVRITRLITRYANQRTICD